MSGNDCVHVTYQYKGNGTYDQVVSIKDKVVSSLSYSRRFRILWHQY